MFLATLFGGLLVAYLLGSVPTAVWLGQALFGKDVREYGSGNAGATNTIRVLGMGPGLAVLAIDVLKGFAATRLPLLDPLQPAFSGNELPFMLLFGLAAVMGHVYPVFAGFKGGKGVATLLGVAIASHPPVAGLAVLVFAFAFGITGYVSVGSMLAALSFPLWLLLPAFAPAHPLLLTFGAAMALAVIYTHRANISRLRNGTENKLFGKRKSQA